MELRHLRYFVAVAEEENVTRAAERLHISQPPLSRQIQDLEEELGVLLFERTARTIRLTPVGSLFLVEAKAVLQRAEEAVQRVRASLGGMEGDLAIGFAPSLSVELLPEALRLFQKSFPKVKVSLHDLSSDEMLRGLHQGRIQLALMAHPGAKCGKGLSMVKLRDYDLCVSLPPGHSLASRKALKSADLRGERLLGYTRSGYPEYHQQVAELLGSAKGKDSPVDEEHDSATALMAAVESGRGVALVASCFAKLAGTRLLVRPIVPRTRAATLSALWKGTKGKAPSGPASHFLQAISDLAMQQKGVKA
ncbi:MAG: LysR family transcriptional regulator [Verrucomicrobia bacterium]|nr:LysR family transcriptional regulator [Verrucomicrobiota bacterium]